MSEPPELKRFDRVPLGLRIRSRPTETKDEPLSALFIYRLRPSRPGDAVLPPISIASFDPSLSSLHDPGDPRRSDRVVAVAAFDPATIVDDGSMPLEAGRSIDVPGSPGVFRRSRRSERMRSLVVVRKRLSSRRLAGRSRGPAIMPQRAGSKPRIQAMGRNGCRWEWLDGYGRSMTLEDPGRWAARRHIGPVDSLPWSRRSERPPAP